VTPNAFHAEQAVMALQYGKHVLCEKPMARTMTEARVMLEAANASGKVHQVNFMYRHLYGVRELKRRVLAGDIGEPYLLRVQYDGWRGLNPDWKIGWRERQELSGGGELVDHGSHLFDIARFLFGRIEHVTGFLHRIHRKQPDVTNGLIADVETDDIAAAWFQHECGIRGQWFASRATPRSEENGWLEVIGPEGALRASLGRGTVDQLQISRPKQISWEPLPLPAASGEGLPHCLTASMNRFVDACIKGYSDLEVDATFIDGVAAQQSLEAVMVANDRLAWVPLSDISGS
jgi:predicted dehydrogenase